MKHTRGPWAVAEMKPDHYVIYQVDAMKNETYTSQENGMGVRTGHEVIASIKNPGLDSAANARLIASAPYMLTFLFSLLDNMKIDEYTKTLIKEVIYFATLEEKL